MVRIELHARVATDADRERMHRLARTVEERHGMADYRNGQGEIDGVRDFDWDFGDHYDDGLAGPRSFYVELATVFGRHWTRGFALRAYHYPDTDLIPRRQPPVDLPPPRGAHRPAQPSLP